MFLFRRRAIEIWGVAPPEILCKGNRQRF